MIGHRRLYHITCRLSHSHELISRPFWFSFSMYSGCRQGQGRGTCCRACGQGEGECICARNEKRNATIVEFVEKIELLILISIYLLSFWPLLYATRRRPLKRPLLKRPRLRRRPLRRKRPPRQRLRYVVSVFIHFSPWDWTYKCLTKNVFTIIFSN